MKLPLAPGVLDLDGRVECLRRGTDVILPQGLAGAGLQGGDKAAPGAALVPGVGRHEMLEPAAGDDELATGKDRRCEEAVGRVSTGEGLRAGVDNPALLA